MPVPAMKYCDAYRLRQRVADFGIPNVRLLGTRGGEDCTVSFEEEASGKQLIFNNAQTLMAYLQGLNYIQHCLK